jgi:DNA topoisomerase IB
MLRYVSDELPGIRRVRSGRGFAYVDSSGRLGNTPAVCRKCYVHPLVEWDYLKRGSLTVARTGAPSQPNDLERSVLHTLKKLARADNRRLRR